MNTKQSNIQKWYLSKQGIIASTSIASISICLILRLIGDPINKYESYPLILSYLVGGVPILFDLTKKIFRFEFDSDILAGISIITALVLDEYLAGTLIILMLSGGKALEEYALRRASSVLDALANRMPNIARLIVGEVVKEIDLSLIKINDHLQILPHDICPVDGVVINGFTSMDESFLTGEPYQMKKAPGSNVISGSLNGESALEIKATSLPSDSRYQKIAKVIEEQESKQVPMKRLGDRLGAWYMPVALTVAVSAWVFSGHSVRFLSILVIATQCPLLIAIPVALIGSISNAASRGIIIKNPAVLELLSTCKTMILDKTGTLTYGKPVLTQIFDITKEGEDKILAKDAALEVYSKHPLAQAVTQAAKDRNITVKAMTSVSERPGEGLTGIIDNKTIKITSRSKLGALTNNLPEPNQGLECVVTEDGAPSAILSFRDVPRKESREFVNHIAKYHGISQVRILSGDRVSEVEHLGALVGIIDVEGGLSPEDKLEEIKRHTAESPTVYLFTS